MGPRKARPDGRLRRRLEACGRPHPPISGLPEIGLVVLKSAKADLR